MIRIITDSMCDLPPEVLETHDITIMPLSAHFGTERFLDGVSMSKAERVQAATPCEEFYISEIGPALGAHAGPGSSASLPMEVRGT